MRRNVVLPGRLHHQEDLKYVVRCIREYKIDLETAEHAYRYDVFHPSFGSWASSGTHGLPFVTRESGFYETCMRGARYGSGCQHHMRP